MSFFKRLEEMADGGTASSTNMPDHVCNRCNQPMTYRGTHALRTGGLNRGWGVAADMVLGARDEAAIDQITEKNVILHVFVCPQCGLVEFVNDPRRGF
ncbi:MAG: hypothetical protein C7B45_06415 [Sulfobacillus acidophilus]|uniref:Uncharacterized protein n=1 Tax=Sulfobacillus acidophilus TaxID=53633 RepID=A0A2T2WK06_9FIRM|nr:MAG: hypothetical protein C7B45_06415 [Sulfobacillus acidophilus]